MKSQIRFARMQRIQWDCFVKFVSLGKLRMSREDKSVGSVTVWAARIGGLVVLLSCFYANYAIDHDQLAWHEKIAFGIVFFFGFFGSISWIRSTYSQAELKASQESSVVKAFWWVLMAVILLMMLAFTFARYLNQ